MKVTLVTGHAADSPRKTGFHFWAEILDRRGDEILWITAGASFVTKLKSPHQVPEGPRNKGVPVSGNITKFIWMPPFHPVNLGHAALNIFAMPLWNLPVRFLPSSLKAAVKGTDVFIIEGGSGLMLVPALLKFCPHATFIYTVSDRLRTMQAHPAVMAAERKALPFFSLIRVPAEGMVADFEGSPVQYIPQGFDAATFDAVTHNPYAAGKNVVMVGDMLFDAEAVRHMAQGFPEWHFHLFGRHARLGEAYGNVTEYGEKRFQDIAAYIKFADTALAPYSSAKDAGYIAQSSLKMIQYSHARLPVVAPEFAKGDRTHVCGYDPNDKASIIRAFEAAIAFDRASIEPPSVYSWEDVLESMLQQTEISSKRTIE